MVKDVFFKRFEKYLFFKKKEKGVLRGWGLQMMKMADLQPPLRFP